MISKTVRGVVLSLREDGGIIVTTPAEYPFLAHEFISINKLLLCGEAGIICVRRSQKDGNTIYLTFINRKNVAFKNFFFEINEEHVEPLRNFLNSKGKKIVEQQPGNVGTFHFYNE